MSVAGQSDLLNRLALVEAKMNTLVDTIILNQSIFTELDNARSDKVKHLENMVELLKMKLDTLTPCIATPISL